MFLPATAAAGSSRFLVQGQEQVVEDSVILGEDDGGHLKLALQSVNLLLEVVQQFGHLLPLLYLLEELYQTEVGGGKKAVQHTGYNTSL